MKQSRLYVYKLSAVIFMFFLVSVSLVHFFIPDGDQMCIHFSISFCLIFSFNMMSLFGIVQGATIVDQSVTIELAPDYKLPAAASVPTTVIPLIKPLRLIMILLTQF